MERIYHPYNLWEDYQCGFYDNCSGSKKSEYISGILEMFNSEHLTQQYMQKVIDEWEYSCQHNLSNISLNRIAYIGQSACCIYCGAPSTVTMEAWSLLSKEIQDRSDKIANQILNNWLNKNL